MYNPLVHETWCTPRGHVQTRECTAFASPSPAGTRSHRLFNARDNPSPSFSPHLVTEEVDICIRGWWRVKRILRASVSFTRAHIKRYARKSCCQPPSDNIHGNILVKQKKCTCIYIYIVVEIVEVDIRIIVRILYI